MATRLNQIVAIVTGMKTRAEKDVEEAYKSVQKPDLFDGLVKTYEPKDEDGPKQPTETKRVQMTTKKAIATFRGKAVEWIDVVATQDVANTNAKADVVVDGEVVLAEVPITHLLFLHHRLVDLATFVSHLPVLDPGDEWEWSAERNCFSSKPVKRNATKKVPRSFELSPATKEHPAQCELLQEDVVVGEWTTTKFSGAMKAEDKEGLLARIDTIQKAVQTAREEANMDEVPEGGTKVGDRLFDFVFGG